MNENLAENTKINAKFVMHLLQTPSINVKSIG